jgi:hypothetical protein
LFNPLISKPKKMFKKPILIALLGLSATGLFAQEVYRDCGVMEVDARLRLEDPEYAARQQAIEEFTANYIANHAGETRTVVTIPVVVHVVYNNATENISDAQVLSQIDVLNADFRRTNADASSTLATFVGVAADTEIEFCMATVDPSGNPTTGITRTSTTKTSFTTDDKVKYTSQGGKDIWDRNDYLNIWVCDLGSGLLGYAQFPGGAAATDGVVCDYAYFGTTGTATAPFDLGRTATHEVGHWLNLRHIWGDGGCAVDDFCADTPSSDGPNYGCNLSTISCSTLDMVQNYMDYTDDACMNLFTEDQKDRMQAIFAAGGSRNSITTSDACGGGGGGATCDVPGSRTTTGITSSQATLNWGAVAGATSYNARGRQVGTATWTTASVAGTSVNFTGLTASTTYEWQVETVCSGGVTSGYSASTNFTTLSAGGGTCTDFGESNNTKATSKVISAGTTYNALIASSTDKDWYKFTTTSPNTKIKVTLTSLPADYDVKLYQNSTVKGLSENAGTADETIIWNTTTAGTRYIQVYGWDGAFNASDCYDMLVQVSSSSWRTDGSEMIIDEQWNNAIVGIFPNPAKDIATINYFSVQEDMNVVVSVFDILGNRVMNTSASVTSGENLIDLDVNNLSSGMYVIEIHNGKSHYTDKFIVE